MALADAAPFAVAHWSLDETSGTRVDSVGSNDLSDSTSVSSATGMFGNAADFESTSNQYLSIADNADLSLSADQKFMIRCWVKLESKTGVSQGLITKDDLAGGNREYYLIHGAGLDRFLFAVFDGSSNEMVAQADNLGSPATGTWYLIHGWHDPVANQVGIAVNAGTANTTAHSGGTRDLGAEFRLGMFGDSSRPADGLIDDVVFLKDYILDATERTADYNGGTGVAFADWAPAGNNYATTWRMKSDSAAGTIWQLTPA